MKKILSLALGALMSLSAWSYDNVPATFAWTVGNENEATVTSDASDGVAQTKVSIGVGLTIAGTKSNYDVNNGHEMVQYQPAESKKGVDPSVMIEYSVKMKKGVTFTLTGISYDAVKDGTDGASYHWSYAVDGTESAVTEVPAEELLRNNGNNAETAQLNHSHAVTATAGQVVAFRIYVSGFANNKKFALSNIQLTGTVNGEAEQRAFTNFKLDFRTNPYTVVEPETLPSNVTLSDLNYNGTQHGLQGGTITVNVDGPVKFTLGACQYGSSIAVKKNGEALTTIANNTGCDNSGVDGGYNHFVNWTYNVEEAAVLSFTVNGSYLPFFFAEACEFVPEVEVRYYDVDGKTLIGEPQVVEGGSALSYAYGASDVTVAEGKAFRGWFNASAPTALKVAEGTPLTENLSLYAKATDIEVAELGKIYEYDLTKNYFYQEDHELFSSEGGKFHDGQHGWIFGNGNTMSIEVAGNALLSVGVCTYSATGTTLVKDAAGNTVGQLEVVNKETTDGAEQTINYTGPATKLTFEFAGTNYIHRVKVYNIAELPVKNDLGYFEVSSGDAAGFLLALTAAEPGDKIFLPNGIYDLGETVLTPISKNNISIIGQSMEGTIIKNAPDFHKEGIGTTATFLITATGTYFQDLTIQNALDYYAAIAAGLEGGRAVVLQDKGTQTICKNVKLLSYQDTYYSNKTGGVYYFEDCEIHGTVDFICGGGNAYFKNNLLYCEKRNLNGSGSDALTASNAEASDNGYVFDGCTIKSECPTVSLGRAWNNTPQVSFVNTLVDYSAGEFSFNSSDIQRWTKQLMSVGAWPLFGEYNTHLADGTVLTPASNVVTFIDKAPSTETQEKETVLSQREAAVRTIDNALGEWGATAVADAKQAVCDLENIEDEAIYLVEMPNGNAILYTGAALKEEIFPEDAGETVRKANARGGFGKPAGEDPHEGIDNTAAESVKVQKIIRNGQLIIIQNGVEYNAQGAIIK